MTDLLTAASIALALLSGDPIPVNETVTVKQTKRYYDRIAPEADHFGEFARAA